MTAEADETNSESITIRVKDPDGEETLFKVKRQLDLRKYLQRKFGFKI